MKEKLLTKNKSQRMLTGVMVALFFVLSVCTIFTGKYVPTEKGLTLWEPERTQKQDDGTRHIYFTADTDREDRSSLVFFTSHQWVEVFADGKQIYKLDYTGGIWGHTTGNVLEFCETAGRCYADRSLSDRMLSENRRQFEQILCWNRK